MTSTTASSQAAGLGVLARIAAGQAAAAVTEAIPKVPTIQMSRSADPSRLSPAAWAVAAAAVVIWFAFGVVAGLHGLR